MNCLSRANNRPGGLIEFVEHDERTAPGRCTILRSALQTVKMLA